MSGGAHRLYQFGPRIAYEWSSRVTYERHVAPFAQDGEQRLGPAGRRVGVKREKAGRSACVRQQHSGAPRVLCSYGINGAQDLNGPSREVLQVAKRSGYYIESCHASRAGASPASYARCFLIRSSMAALGTAPTMVSTWRPSRKNSRLGMERTLKR